MANNSVKDQSGQLNLTGQLDKMTVPKLWAQRDQLLANLSDNNSPLIINLEQVDQTDTAGIAFLACLQAEATKQNINLQYVKVPEQMQSLIAVSGLEDILSLG